MNGRVEELFHQVADLSLEARVRYFDEHAVNDEIRREVEALLAFDAGASAFLEQDVGYAAGRALAQLESVDARRGPYELQGRQILANDPARVGREGPIQIAMVAAGTALGPYKIEGTIGSGGMGEVYRAIDTRLGRTVAIKQLPRELSANPVYRRRLLQEARAMSALNHSNIVILYDISSYNGADFLVMEYVAGRSLKELIPPEGLAIEQVLNLGVQAASALAAAHAAGIVHRDVKPANILVTESHVVKVLDFGIAKFPNDRIPIHLTGSGQVMGTVAYMSPEQTRGEEIDASSDIFSLGCVLYEAATGRRPFGGTSALAVMHEIATAEPPAASTVQPRVPVAFDALIAKCLHKTRGERFQSMAELCSALNRKSSHWGHGMLAPGPIASIVVLPFVSAGEDADTERFGDGLAEELIGALSLIPQLLVTPRSSAFSFRDQGMDAREIGRRLHAGTVLEGSVRRAGQRLRINAQLIDIAGGYPIWSERFDRALTDVFDLQDEITATVVGQLRQRLLGESKDGRKLVAKRFTEDAEAYTLFLQGRHPLEQTAHWNPCGDQVLPEGDRTRPEIRSCLEAWPIATTHSAAGRRESYLPRKPTVRGGPMRKNPCIWIRTSPRATLRWATVCCISLGICGPPRSA